MPVDSETRDWLLEHHKDAYMFQSERSDKIRDSVSFISGLLSMLGGGIAYFLSTYTHRWNSPFVTMSFYGPLALALTLFIAAVVITLYCIARGYKYCYVLTPKQIEDYANDLMQYVTLSGSPVNILADVKENMARRYADAATHNMNVNTRRILMLVRATQISAFSFSSLALSLPAHFIQKASEKPAPAKIVITEPIRLLK